MSSKYQKIPKFTGVFAYTSQDSKYKGKPDKCFFIRYIDQYKKQVWEKVGWQSEGYSAQYAANIRNERIHSVRHSEMPESQKQVTFGDVWKEYEKWLEKGRTRPQDDKQRYKDHLQTDLESLPISQISPHKLDEIKNKLFDKGYSPATVKHCLVIVRQVINKAIYWNYWSGSNPVSKIKLPQAQNQRERFLSYEEAQQLIADLGRRSTQLQNMAILSLETGMRAGEIFSLRWQDINLNAKIINVRGKGGYDRQAFITDKVQQVFQSQRKIVTNQRNVDFVFQSRGGSKVNKVSHSFDRAVKDLELNAGIHDRKQSVSFHTLRHTFASWLALEGIPILTIKELMGHKSIEMTMRYAHLIPDHKFQAVTQISGRWSVDESDQDNPQYP